MEIENKEQLLALLDCAKKGSDEPSPFYRRGDNDVYLSANFLLRVIDGLFSGLDMISVINPGSTQPAFEALRILVDLMSLISADGSVPEMSSPAQA